MVVKLYVSGISGNKEVKKRQQRVMMILDSKSVKYDVIDIAEPGKDTEKEFMQNHSKANGSTVSDPNPRHPLPPQVFNDEEYCGDYDQFDLANEIDTLEQFLKVEVPKSEEVSDTKPNGETATEESKESSAKSEEEKAETKDEPGKTDETETKDNLEEEKTDESATKELEKGDAPNEDEGLEESKITEKDDGVETKSNENDDTEESKTIKEKDVDESKTNKDEDVEENKTNKDEGFEESKVDENEDVKEDVSRVSSSRESSKEKEVKTNGVKEEPVEKEVAEPQTTEPEIKKDLSSSEALIESEKQPA